MSRCDALYNEQIVPRQAKNSNYMFTNPPVHATMVSVVFRTVRSGFRHSNGFLCARRLIRGATPKKEDHSHDQQG